MLLGQEVPDLLGDQRRAPLSAADIDGEAKPALGIFLQVKADVMHLDRRAVALGAGHGYLELARQIRELRMNRRPLPQDLGIGTRVGDLVGGGTGEVVGGHVANAVAARLDGMHLDGSEVGEDSRHIGQRRPVVLDVLARGEMAVALVVFARDMAEHAQLPGVQRAVGNGDAQHISV